MPRETSHSAPILAFALLLASNLFPLPVAAQEQGSKPPAETGSNSESTEAFRRQLKPLIQANISGDAENLAEALKAFYLPAPEDWFAQNFGADNSRPLLEEYEKAFGRFESGFADLFNEKKKRRPAQVVASALDHPSPAAKPFPGMKVPLRPVATEEFVLNFVMRNNFSFTWVITCVRVDNSFRFVGLGDHAFWAVPPHRRITVGANVQSLRLIQRVEPVYPESAKKQDVTGTVRLRAIIDIGGNVMQLDVESGPPPLQQAALDAVRQWRYQPALLNGEPIEVQTTIEVGFTVPPKSPA